MNLNRHLVAKGKFEYITQEVTTRSDSYKYETTSIELLLLQLSSF